MTKSKNQTATDQTTIIDLLEVMFKGTIPLTMADLILDNSGNHRTREYSRGNFIEYTNERNATYGHIFNLYIDTRLIGELRYSNHCPFVNSELINFRFNNVILYQENFIQYIDYIQSIFKLQFQYINHIDIAIDRIGYKALTETNHYLSTISPFNPNAATYKTKHKGRVQLKDITTNHVNLIHWGKMKSLKYLKIYDKIAQMEAIKEKTDKKYIIDFWRKNGMSIDKGVERIELTLKQKHSKLLDYNQLNDTDYLTSIFKSHCMNFYQLEKTAIRNGKETKKDVTPISFNIKKTILIPKFKQVTKYTLTSEKITLKNLYFNYLLAHYIADDYNVVNGFTIVPDELKDYESIYDNIQLYLYKYPSLTEYFNKKKKQYKNEFVRTNEIFKGLITIDEYLKTLQLTQKIEFDQTNDFREKNSDELNRNLEYENNQRKLNAKLFQMNRYHDTLEIQEVAKKSNYVTKMTNPTVLKVIKANNSEINLRAIELSNKTA